VADCDPRPVIRRFERRAADDYVTAVLELGAGATVLFIKRVRATASLSQPLLLVIGEWGTGGPALALSQRVDAYEPKPIDAARLVDSVERLLGTKALSARGKIGAE